MRPSKYLKKLRHKTGRRLYKLSLLADHASRLPLPKCDQIISYITIESLNIWANFARAYFLSCSLTPWRESGSRITLTNSTIHTFDDAIDAAMRRCKYNIWKKGVWSRRDEPPWHKPKTLIDSCDEIGCSNHADILRAFTFATKVFEHLPKFRNFYAHRNDHTVSLAKNVAHQYSIPIHNHPSEILCVSAYGRPQILLLDWIDDINLTVEMLCI